MKQKRKRRKKLRESSEHDRGRSMRPFPTPPETEVERIADFRQQSSYHSHIRRASRRSSSKQSYGTFLHHSTGGIRGRTEEIDHGFEMDAYFENWMLTLEILGPTWRQNSPPSSVLLKRKSNSFSLLNAILEPKIAISRWSLTFGKEGRTVSTRRLGRWRGLS